MNKITLSTGLSTYVILSTMLAIPTGPILINALEYPKTPGLLGMIIIIISAWGVLYSWLISIKIEISQEGIGYRELFKKHIFFRFEDIDGFNDISINEILNFKKLNKTAPPMRLIIYGRSNGKSYKMMINTKVLNLKDVHFLWEILEKIRVGSQLTNESLSRPE